MRFDEMDEEYIGNWAKRLGEAIGKSSHLRKLCITPAIYERGDTDTPPPFGLPSLFMGIAENRSIEELSLSDFNHSHMNIFTTLAPFFENNPKLRCLHITNSIMPSKMRVPSFVSALASTSKLEKIDISDNHLGDRRTADIIDVLASLPGLHNLVELNLGDNEIRKKGCTALRKLLRTPANKLRVLFLNNNDIDDACVDILYGGLVANNSITFINLQYQKNITPSGWSVFFDVLSNSVCSLDRILVCGNTLGEDGAISLGKSLVGNGRVNALHLRGCSTDTTAGWQGFSKCLESPGSSLVFLDLSGCVINDDGAVKIASALATNTVLGSLRMEGIKLITSSGWRIFFSRLMHCVSSSAMARLSFSDNNIDDVGVALLVRCLARMNQLAFFSLNKMTSVSINGWGVFADILKPLPTPKLLELDIGSRIGPPFETIAMDDDIIISFADALIGNTTFKRFEFMDCSFSENGWTALANTLCDKSSIDSTFCSNHTFHEFYRPRIPCDLKSVLEMNRERNKTKVARKKILLHHLVDLDSILHEFVPMSASVLPVALSWLGRDRKEYSRMFQIIQSMPWLTGSAIKSDTQVVRE